MDLPGWFLNAKTCARTEALLAVRYRLLLTRDGVVLDARLA